MVPFAKKLSGAGTYVLILACIIAALFIFRHDLGLFFQPDPPVTWRYQHSFGGDTMRAAPEIMTQHGFTVRERGLHLAPHTSGSITLAFEKRAGQGCLLRVWFYGDGGHERPNALKVSVDNGRSFHQLAGSGNYVGSVFDLTSPVEASSSFQLLFEAHNHAPYEAPVLESIEVLIAAAGPAKPVLPPLTRMLGLVLLLTVPPFLLFSGDAGSREKATRVVFLLIMLLAVSLRWNELVRVSGTGIDGDALGYYRYAEKMDLFSEQGFYSAQFEKREPLYILVVKLFFAVFGASGTHLRFVSCVFSLVALYLTYRIGREWFSGIAGLTAAFILAVHPYLIELSARGLRAEWFQTLVLLFVYVSSVKAALGARLRTVLTGLLIGGMLLTRSESLFMVVMIMAVFPVAARSRWNYAMVFTALFLGITLSFPHQYGMYKKHGDPFYTVNQYARFYANREFAGQPGFPTREELATGGMYTGGKITPWEYYFSLHTPWQFVRCSMVGFARVHLAMPLYFAAGKGNEGSIAYALEALQKNTRGEQLAESVKRIAATIKKDWADYARATLVLVSFILGLVFIAVSPHRLLLLYMLLFQVQTSFLACLGIDSRLTVHSYPLIALCCGYCIGRVKSGVMRGWGMPAVTTTVPGN